LSINLGNVARRVLAVIVLSLVVPVSVAFADDWWHTTPLQTPTQTSAPAPPPPAAAPNQDTGHWTAYGFDITAPGSMWPMLELLHKQHFDWQLYSAQQRPTPLVWADLPTGVFGQYDRSNNVIRLANVLQTSSVEARTAFLAHELTHLNDDLNGRLADSSSETCYAAETRAFENEANFWIMTFGPDGKKAPDAFEARENTKMRAFVGHQHFADLVVRTTPSYVRQCGADN
jgi:hypothetical protein